MQIKLEPELDFSDVLILPKFSTLKSRKDPDLHRELKFYHTGKRWTGIPIICSNMNTGTYNMARALASHKMLTALHKHHSIETLVDFYKTNEIVANQYTFYTLGISEKDTIKYEKFCTLYGKPDKVCIDVANANTKTFIEFVKRFRDENPNTIIMAGNIVTGSVATQLVQAGAEIIKTGLGSGGQCLTRRVTSVGRPQLSAVIEVSDAVNGIGAHMCSDGGCTQIGDICVAFGGGSHFVMLGSMLSGHAECDGEIREVNGEKFMQFFGMSSNTAMKQYDGGKSEYKASEGRTTLIPFKGSVHETIREIKGGISSLMTYINAHKLKDITKCTTFVKVNTKLNQTYEKFTIGN